MIEEFIDLAKSKIGCGYVYGSQGEIMTQDRLNVLIHQQGISHYHLSDGTKAEKWLGKQCFDCSGLILWCLTQLGLLPKGTDTTAQGLYSNYCIPITKEQLKQGDLVFIKQNGSIVHVGMFDGNGKTVEAYGTAKGVIQGSVERFNVFGRLICFKDELEKPADELADALKFLSDKAGIDYDVWLKVARTVKYLDKCFIKISDTFKKVG